MPYRVKEIFLTLQGEGFHTGRPAVFCRFSGCNLWSGKEKDREKAICNFCDTDFVGTDGQNGGVFPSASELADKIISLWKGRVNEPFIVFTGGEPLLQLDSDLIGELKRRGCIISVESNGTVAPPEGIDHLCISPKTLPDGKPPFKVFEGDEMKLVYPQEGLDPSAFEELDFTHFYLQPKDERGGENHFAAVVSYCLHHPQWKLSLQTHKILGID